ncbi:oligopeptide ABC transporter permease [Mycoplasmopsis pulmonis]|nr:oligopeptide ABC transporter permease [Mycoplasmopsis pulmonis]
MYFVKYATKKFILFFIFFVLFLMISSIFLEIFVDLNKNYNFNNWLNFWKRFWTFNFGSFKSDEFKALNFSVASLYFYFFKNSFLVIFFVIIFALFFGVIAGSLFSFYARKKSIQILNTLIYFLSSIPIFIIVALFVLILSKFDLTSFYIPFDQEHFLLWFNSIIQIFFLLFFPMFFAITFIVKNICDKLFFSEHFMFLLSKGFSIKKIYFYYFLKNIFIKLIPFINVFYMLTFSYSLFVESIFSFTGQSMILTSAFNRGESSIIYFSLFINLIIIFIIDLLLNILLKILNPSNLNIKKTIGFLDKIKIKRTLIKRAN